MNELIPFGKYKDKPVEFLANDKDYINWLLSTDWFKDKYSNIYNIVINNFHEPLESPQHNKLQIKFLSEEHRLKFALAVFNEKLSDFNLNRIDEAFINIFIKLIKFYSLKYSQKIEWLKHSIEYDEKSIIDYPDTPRSKLAKEHIDDNRQALTNFITEDKFIEAEIWKLLQKFDNTSFEFIKFSNLDFEHSKTASDVSFTIEIGCINSYELIDTLKMCINSIDRIYKLFHFSIEIKPVVYDDYPAILRQIKHSGAQYLLIEEYRGKGATEEEFVDYFKTQGITVLFEKQVTTISIPNYPTKYLFNISKFLGNKKKRSCQIEWNIENEGRPWSLSEENEKIKLIPNNLLCKDGKLFDSEEQRFLLLKMLFEHVGKRKALEIINEAPSRIMTDAEKF